MGATDVAFAAEFSAGEGVAFGSAGGQAGLGCHGGGVEEVPLGVVERAAVGAFGIAAEGLVIGRLADVVGIWEGRVLVDGQAVGSTARLCLVA